MKNIYCIAGPSGSGKTTIAEELKKRYGMKVLESYTTRAPRYEGETGHIFVTSEKFHEMEMCAYTVFDGNEYGVTPDLIEKNDIYIIDIAGVDYLREHYTGSKGLKVIGLITSRTILQERMEQRGDKPENIQRRLEHDEIAFSKLLDIPDIVVKSDHNIDAIVETIYNWIKGKERD